MAAKKEFASGVWSLYEQLIAAPAHCVMAAYSIVISPILILCIINPILLAYLL